MNYLVMSDAGSMHVYNFVRNNLSNRGWNIIILSHSNVPIPKEYAVYYHANNIRVISITQEYFSGKTDLLSKIKKLIFKIRKIREIGEIDVCHIHCLASSSCMLYMLCRRQFKHLILTFWGSDIIKSRRGEVFLQKKCLPYADRITLSTKKTLGIFEEKFSASFRNKTNIVRFVSGALYDIKENEKTMSRAWCKEYLGFPTNKVSIMIGYNADPEQHQDECLRIMQKMRVDVKQRIHIIVPLQYARTNSEYIEAVKKQSKECGFSTSILEEYFDSNKMAILALATDVYVNIRRTDAFSCCMKEQLYSGTMMVQGKWLEYRELDEINWPRILLESREELSDAIYKIVTENDFDIPKHKCELMWDLFSPDGVRSQWNKVYKEIL